MAKAVKAPVVNIELPPLDIKVINITLVGDSSLIVHAWSKKAKTAMLEKQMKSAKTAKAAKDPWMDFCESLHWISPMPERPTEEDVAEGKFGFPAVGFKNAAVDACTHADGVTKVAARGVFHMGLSHLASELIEIEYPGGPSMREDMVRISMGTADIRHRAEFKVETLPDGTLKTWRVALAIRYNASMFSPAQIVNLFNVSGFAVGIGEWRPAKDGSNGMFHVQTDTEAV